jgi:hypothetical protein
VPASPAPAQPAYRWGTYEEWYKSLNTHGYTICYEQVFAAARELAPAPAPVPAKPEPSASPDVGEGYERVPDGTVITEEFEFIRGKTWEKAGYIGGTVGDFPSVIYRRPVKPKPEPVKVLQCHTCVIGTMCSAERGGAKCLDFQRLATAIAAKGEK